MLLFVLLSNFYGNKVQDIQIENYPTKIFLKKTEILFAFSNKDVPLHPAKQKGFLFTPAHYLEPIGVAVFRQTASDPNDFTSSSVYQNPGWKYEASTGAVSVE